MDETEIHQENVCIEPVSMVSHDPLTDEIELMETKFQIDMETEGNKAISNNNVECDSTWTDEKQIEIKTEPFALIDVHKEAKSSSSALDSQSDENEYICDTCSESFGSKSSIKRHLREHFEKPLSSVETVNGKIDVFHLKQNIMATIALYSIYIKTIVLSFW